MAVRIPDNDVAILVSCDLTDLIVQLPEGPEKNICRGLNSFIEDWKNVLSSRQGCSDAVLALNNLQSCTRQLLITIINNPDSNVIRLQSQEVYTAVRNTITVTRANHPDEFERIYMSFQQNIPAGNENRRGLQQGSEDLLERLVPFYENLQPQTRPPSYSQLQERRSSPSNSAMETERTPLLESENALDDHGEY